MHLYGERLKIAARAILFDLPSVIADASDEIAVRDTVTFMSDRICDGDGKDDPSAKSSELAAELVYFALHHPLEISAVFSSVLSPLGLRVIDIRTWDGLKFVVGFYRGLDIGHTWVLDPSTEMPRVRRDGDCGVYVAPLTKAELFAALQAYRLSLAEVTLVSIAA